MLNIGLATRARMNRLRDWVYFKERIIFHQIKNVGGKGFGTSTPVLLKDEALAKPDKLSQRGFAVVSGG